MSSSQILACMGSVEEPNIYPVCRQDNFKLRPKFVDIYYTPQNSFGGNIKFYMIYIVEVLGTQELKGHMHGFV